MKMRYMKGGDDDEEDEYVFTVKSVTQPKKVEVIVGGCVMKMAIDSGARTNVVHKGLWSELKAAEDRLCIQEVWQEALCIWKQGAIK